MNLRTSVPTTFFLLLFPIVVIGQQAWGGQEDSLLRYADSLFNHGDYKSSILEYKRLLFYHPDTGVTDFVRYRIAQGYYYQEDSEKAQQMLGELTKIHPNSPLYFHAQLMLGKSYFDAEDYATARIIYSRIIHADANEQLSAQAQYLRGWCYVHEWNWLKGIAEFRKVRRFQPDTSLSVVSNQLADATLANIPLPLKSPERAQWLSTFLPGVGQIYAGQFRNGLISTVVNAAFLYLAADATRDERYVDAVGVSLVGLWFYWRNRSSAKTLAAEHNRELAIDLIRELKKKSVEIEPINIELPEVGEALIQRRECEEK